MSDLPLIESRFGWEWRKAVYRAGAPMEPSRLAAVFVDLAYAPPRSTVVQVSENVLRDAAVLYGRSFTRAREWLIEHRFIELFAPGKSHVPASWRLVMPESFMPAQERVNAELASPAQERVKRDTSSPAPSPALTPASSPASSPAQERALLEPLLEENQTQGRARTRARESAPAVVVDNALGSNDLNGAVAAAIITGYVELLQQRMDVVPDEVVGPVRRAVERLIAQGVPATKVAEALRLMHDKRLPASTLATFLVDAHFGPRRRSVNEHTAEVLFRETYGFDAADLLTDEGGTL